MAIFNPTYIVRQISLIAVTALCAAASGGTVQTTGSGSAVITADRIATFNILNQANNGYGISDYVEDNIFIGVDGDNWVGDGFPVFDPFDGAPGSDAAFQYPEFGSTSWVVISTTDNKRIYGLEFIYGNGWTTGNPNDPWGIPNGVLEWKTWRSGSLVSSGTVGATAWLALGTVIGLSDSAGVDELWIRCTSAESSDPNLQALAIDNVRVQLSPGSGTCLGDLTNDHEVNGADLAILLGAWGSSGAADLDGSGLVNGADLAVLLGGWGACP